MSGALLVAVDRQALILKRAGSGRQLHTHYSGISALRLTPSVVRWTEYEAYHPWMRLGTDVPMTDYP